MIKILFALAPIVLVLNFSNTSSNSHSQQLGDTIIITSNSFVKFITPYRDGLKHGTEYRIYHNGDTMEVLQYKKDKLDGKAVAYYEDNRIALIRYFKDGCNTGDWLHYDTLRNLQTKTIFDKPSCPDDVFWSKREIVFENGKKAYTKIWKNSKQARITIHDASLYNRIQERERPLVGQKTFNAQCAMCHAIKKELVGPALLEPVRTRNQSWLTRFIRNGDALYKQGDTAAKRLYQQYYMIKHPDFTHLTKNELESIIKYIKEKK